jgi:hypothetical protein
MNTPPKTTDTLPTGPQAAPAPAPEAQASPKPKSEKVYRKQMTAAGRARIIAAQKLRWANLKDAQNGNAKPVAAQVPAVIEVKTALNLDGPATWDTVKYWADLAAKFQHASVAAQVMAGFGLIGLRKQLGTNQGKRNDLCDTTSPHDVEKLDWPDLVKQHAGISDESARRWMAMAQGIKARWKKLAPQARLKELMSVPPSDWSKKDTKLVADSLRKATDGSSQLEFMRELGLAKKAPGNPNAKGGVARQLTTEEQAEQLKAMALEHSGAIGGLLNLSNKDFVLLDDLEVTCQVAEMEFALKLRRAWLDLPKDKRNADAIAKMIKERK